MASQQNSSPQMMLLMPSPGHRRMSRARSCSAASLAAFSSSPRFTKLLLLQQQQTSNAAATPTPSPAAFALLNMSLGCGTAPRRSNSFLLSRRSSTSPSSGLVARGGPGSSPTRGAGSRGSRSEDLAAAGPYAAAAQLSPGSLRPVAVLDTAAVLASKLKRSASASVAWSSFGYANTTGPSAAMSPISQAPSQPQQTQPPHQPAAASLSSASLLSSVSNFEAPALTAATTQESPLERASSSKLWAPAIGGRSSDSSLVGSRALRDPCIAPASLQNGDIPINQSPAADVAVNAFNTASFTDIAAIPAGCYGQKNATNAILNEQTLPGSSCSTLSPCLPTVDEATEPFPLQPSNTALLLANRSLYRWPFCAPVGRVVRRKTFAVGGEGVGQLLSDSEDGTPGGKSSNNNGLASALLSAATSPRRSPSEAAKANLTVIESAKKDYASYYDGRRRYRKYYDLTSDSGLAAAVSDAWFQGGLLAVCAAASPFPAAPSSRAQSASAGAADVGSNKDDAGCSGASLDHVRPPRMDPCKSSLDHQSTEIFIPQDQAQEAGTMKLQSHPLHSMSTLGENRSSLSTGVAAAVSSKAHKMELEFDDSLSSISSRAAAAAAAADASLFATAASLQSHSHRSNASSGAAENREGGGGGGGSSVKSSTCSISVAAQVAKINNETLKKTHPPPPLLPFADQPLNISFADSDCSVRLGHQPEQSGLEFDFSRKNGHVGQHGGEDYNLNSHGPVVTSEMPWIQNFSLARRATLISRSKETKPHSCGTVEETSASNLE